MLEKEMVWKTKDGLSLKGRYWSCEGQVLMRLLIIHGLGEHCGRYGHVAQYFNAKGVEVFAFDQRGHGLSEGKRGFSPTHAHLLEDLRVVKNSIEKGDGIPLFLYGHSFGGNVLSAYLMEYGVSDICGAIISAAWFKLAFEPPKFEVALGRLMNKIWPAFSQSNKLKIEDLTYDEKVNKAYAEDPLVHDQITAALFVNAYAAGLNNMHKGQLLKVPSLIIHGEDDLIISQDGSKALYESAKKSTLKIWEKTKHEPHNDLRKNEVLEYNFQWMESIAQK